MRDQEWRNRAVAGLHTWKTSLDHTRSQIPEEELQQTPPNSEYQGSQTTSFEDSNSDYLPLSPLDSPPGKGRRIPTRSQPGCSPLDVLNRAEREDSPDSDPNPESLTRQRGISQVLSTTATQESARRTTSNADRGQYQQHAMMRFCAQRCLLGLQQNGALDTNCPNFRLHRSVSSGNQHPISAEHLVGLLKQQLDEDLDHYCTPFGNCGVYGAPFMVTCAAFWLCCGWEGDNVSSVEGSVP